MPRNRLPPRIYQRRPDRWVILDHKREWYAGSTAEEATAALHRYVNPDEFKDDRRQRFLSRRGVVYFIEAEATDLVKVGFTTGLPKRMADLRTALPIALRLIAEVKGTRAKEFEIHRDLAPHRIRGEWFSKAPTIEYLGAKLGIQSTS